jgi:hypothetical protein
MLLPLLPLFILHAVSLLLLLLLVLGSSRRAAGGVALRQGCWRSYRLRLVVGCGAGRLLLLRRLLGIRGRERLQVVVGGLGSLGRVLRWCVPLGRSCRRRLRLRLVEELHETQQRLQRGAHVATGSALTRVLHVTAAKEERTNTLPVSTLTMGGGFVV